jgi:hypothetical protein
VLSCYQADAAEAKRLWQIDVFKKLGKGLPTFGVCCSPLVVGNVVLVNVRGRGCSLVAGDADKSQVLWSKNDEPASTCSPVLFAGPAGYYHAYLARHQVPHFARLTVQRGVNAKAFGPLPLIGPPAEAPAAQSAAARKGPAWFQVMDRNEDGLVSPQEFLGPPELFRRLNLNGDGVIDAHEAWRAELARRSG